MSERDQVSKVTLCVKIQKWQTGSQSPTHWPRSGIELPGQLKKQLCLRLCVIFVSYPIENHHNFHQNEQNLRWYELSLSPWSSPSSSWSSTSHHSHLSLIVSCYYDRMSQIEADVSQTSLTLWHHSLCMQKRRSFFKIFKFTFSPAHRAACTCHDGGQRHEPCRQWWPQQRQCFGEKLHVKRVFELYFLSTNKQIGTLNREPRPHHQTESWDQMWREDFWKLTQIGICTQLLFKPHDN